MKRMTVRRIIFSLLCVAVLTLWVFLDLNSVLTGTVIAASSKDEAHEIPTLASQLHALENRVDSALKALEKRMDTQLNLSENRMDAWNTLEKRLQAIERIALDVTKHNPPTEVCPYEVGDFTSKEKMLAAGWRIDLTDVDFGPRLFGWKSGSEVGSVSIRFNVSGRMSLHVKNAYGEQVPDNKVIVTLNKKELGTAHIHEDIKLCFWFWKGDMLSIREHMAQIRIMKLKIQCIAEQGAMNSKQVQCTVGQQVRIRPKHCDMSGGYEGTIEKAYADKQALVKLGPPASVTQVFAAKHLFIQPEPGQRFEKSFEEASIGLSPIAQCSSLSPFSRRKIGLLTIADQQFRHSFEPQIQSMSCYARHHGYDHFVLDGGHFPVCEKYVEDFFFQKHCLVAQLLRLQDEGYIAVVVDADVVAVVLSRGIEAWLEDNFNIQFYTRMQIEIAAGNYIARNSLWTRNFLMDWADYFFQRPKGYSSSDNGALHPHILNALDMPGKSRCMEAYKSLVSPIPGGPEYFSFIRVFREVLQENVGGNHGTASFVFTKNKSASILFLPQKANWVTDRGVVGFTESRGPVLLHGIKGHEAPGQARKEVNQFYDDLDRCLQRPIDII